MLLIRGRELANSRGFVEPLPLSRCQQGWVVSKSGREQQSLLLGTISVAKCTLTTLTAQAKKSKTVVLKDVCGVESNGARQFLNANSKFEKTGIEMSPITVQSGLILA